MEQRVNEAGEWRKRGREIYGLVTYSIVIEDSIPPELSRIPTFAVSISSSLPYVLTQSLILHSAPAPVQPSGSQRLRHRGDGRSGRTGSFSFDEIR